MANRCSAMMSDILAISPRRIVPKSPGEGRDGGDDFHGQLGVVEGPHWEGGGPVGAAAQCGHRAARAERAAQR